MIPPADTPPAEAVRELRLLVGVCGSISSVAVPHLVLWMHSALGVTRVRVVMTRSARDLLGRKVMEAVAGDGVVTDWDDVEDKAAPHVALAAWADVVVLPATANFLGKVANGIADDLLTSTVLAATCPVAMIPVMNAAMWAKPVVRRNVARLREDGVQVVEPTAGRSLNDGQDETGSLGDFRPALVAAIARAAGAGTGAVRPEGGQG